MKEITEKKDDLLYYAWFIEKNQDKVISIWNEIKEDKKLLKSAIKVVRDRFDERDTFLGTTIVYSLLVDYKYTDKNIYQELINLIYSNKDLARIVTNGPINGGNSFLLITLFNKELKLTSEQKAFAIEEAMNKIGTVKQIEKREIHEKSLDQIACLKDDPTVMMEFDRCYNPIGTKTGNMYLFDLLSGIDSDQAHGDGDYDIRYWILRNDNFTKEEKQKLVYDFFYDNEFYSELLYEWEWGIINDNLNADCEPLIDIDEIEDITYEELLKRTDEKTAIKIMKEINFTRLMHELRPTSWEEEYELSLN